MRLLLLAATLALAGCTVGPDYRGPPAAGQGRWLEPANSGPVDTAWWERFGDPRLTGLIARAMANAPDLAEAEARLAEARANRDAAAGGRLPNLRATGSATENLLSRNGQLPIDRLPGFQRDFSLFDLGFDASWELDLWGGRTRQVQAAEARVGAAEAARADVTVQLVAEIARNYLDLRAAQAEAATARSSAAADAELDRLTSQRYAAGESSRLEAESAAAAARTSAAAVPQAEARAAGAAYRIAALLGASPEAVVPDLLLPAPLPSSPDRILVGLRTELLERRPDIRRAERELAAATADIGVATADLFPRFSLLGSIGQQARDAGDLLSAGSSRLQIGPSFSWPIFSGGTIRARIRAADARAQAAAARYEKAVAGALADSEKAINLFLKTREAAAQAEAALGRERAALALAEQRAASGEDDRLALQRARKAEIAAAGQADAAAAAKAEAAVALFKALGGGWR